MKAKFTLFDFINIIFILTLTLICIYPLWYVIVVSFSTLSGYYSNVYQIIPASFTFDNYLAIIQDNAVLKAFIVSLKVTSLGLVISIPLTAMAGYAFTKSHLPGVNLMYKMALFTMYFSGGIVPMYLLINNLGLKNNIFALIFPMALNTFYTVLARNYFKSLPQSLEESAKLDGANEFQILIRIILPISTPIIAALSLFYAVDYWNNFQLSVFFISDQNLIPLQLFIRTLITGAKEDNMAKTALHKNGMNMAAIFIAIVPIIVIYPFIQKYFAQGIMIGAVKG